MKLKLDLHPIYNDTRAIETALQSIVEEAVAKRAAEIEIIPGKGSGALKKTVLRFLERPEIKSQYHRLEKDSDNWGRLFVHFRPVRTSDSPSSRTPQETAEFACFCCQAVVKIMIDRDRFEPTRLDIQIVECPACGSPNQVTLRLRPVGQIAISVTSGYA